MTTQEWIDRISNILDIQKETGADTMSMKLTRAELIQLRIFVKVIQENVRRQEDE